jgi:hypothetical protein
MTEVPVSSKPIVESAALDEGIWQTWQAKNRAGDLLTAKRMAVSLIMTPFLIALVWFGMRS